MIIRNTCFLTLKPSFPQGHGRLDVIATIGGICTCLLVGMTAWSKPAASTGATRCQDNLRRLTMAWSLFSDDHEGQLLRTQSTFDNRDRPNWLTGNQQNLPEGVEWMRLPTTQLGSLNPELGLVHSPMFSYLELGEEKATAFTSFRCPADPSRGSHSEYRSGKSSPRIRSYSMNNWIGGASWLQLAPEWMVYHHRSDIVRPSPSKLMVFLGERADSINDTQLLISMAGYVPNKPAAFNARVIDYPSFYHASGASISFADGHVERKQWKDPRTIPAYRQGSLIPLNVPSPSSPDVAWLQSHASAKKH